MAEPLDHWSGRVLAAQRKARADAREPQPGDVVAARRVVSKVTRDGKIHFVVPPREVWNEIPESEWAPWTSRELREAYEGLAEAVTDILEARQKPNGAYIPALRAALARVRAAREKM